MTACPKPIRHIHGTTDCTRFMGVVARLPCLICGLYGVQCHHSASGRYSQGKRSDYMVLPLCVDHHDEFHKAESAWEAKHGMDYDFLPAVYSDAERIAGNDQERMAVEKARRFYAEWMINSKERVAA